MLSRLQSLPRDARDTVFLLAVIAWVLLPQVNELPLWCSALAGAVLLWRGWLAVKARPLPGKRWLLLLLAATLAATWLTHRTLLGRDAGVTLLVVLLTLKTLELRAKRDAFVVFFLGFFCMLSNFFYSQSLLTAFSMLLGLLGLLTMLVNAHMPVGRPPLSQAAKTAGWMALLGTPIMLVLFLLFPRLAPLWGVPSDAMTGRSGLSQSMQVGTIAKLALDESVAMRLRFDGTPPRKQDMYFRGPVLANFDGREWRPSRLNTSARFGVTANLTVSGAPLNYEVTLEPTNRPWLFVMEAAAQPPALPSGFLSGMQADLQWLTNRPINDLLRYKAQSYPDFQHGPLQTVPGLQEFIDLPSGFNPRTRALAREIRGDPRLARAGTAQLVEEVMNRLRTGGYTYTLEPGVYGEHSADEFWFDRKQGFCEHIASAFVILMRSMDIPARIVTGYQGGELNTVDGFWVVRQSAAHAWAEVWESGRGWVRVDPTSVVAPSRIGEFDRLVAPQGTVERALRTFSPTLMTQLRLFWEATNNSWNQWVLNYTQGRQLNLLQNLGFESPSWEDLSYLLIGIVVAAALVGAGWTWWDRTHHDPWVRLLARARKQLEKAGIRSTPASSPRQLAQEVLARYGPQSGSAAQAIANWLLRLEQQRYAAPAGAVKAAPQLHALKEEFSRLNWPA